MGVAAAASYSGGSAGCTWTAGMRRMAAGRVVTAAMTGAAALWPFGVSQRGKSEDDDDDVGVTQGGPTWQCPWAARGRWPARAVGWAGQWAESGRGPVGWLAARSA
jgi:hypothetical protein